MLTQKQMCLLHDERRACGRAAYGASERVRSTCGDVRIRMERFVCVLRRARLEPIESFIVVWIDNARSLNRGGYHRVLVLIG